MDIELKFDVIVADSCLEYILNVRLCITFILGCEQNSYNSVISYYKMILV